MINVNYAEQTAGYFAQVIDTPWIVKQDRLNELREHMGAAESPDFDLATYLDTSAQVVKVGRLFSLPFRLSLGLHESVEPAFNQEASLAIYGVYRSTKPMDPKLRGYKREIKKGERASSAVAGAFVEAAADRRYEDVLLPTLRLARKNKLILSSDVAFAKLAIRVLQRI